MLDCVDRSLPARREDTNDIDVYDRRILDIIEANGRISISDLAVKINLSVTATQRRFKKLISNGLIVGLRAIVKRTRPAEEVVAFFQVRLSDPRPHSRQVSRWLRASALRFTQSPGIGGVRLSVDGENTRT